MMRSKIVAPRQRVNGVIEIKDFYLRREKKKRYLLVYTGLLNLSMLSSPVFGGVRNVYISAILLCN